MDEWVNGVMVGIAVGCFMTLVAAALIYANETGGRNKRCIELKVATYEAGNFKYLDKNIEYIITGNK